MSSSNYLQLFHYPSRKLFFYDHFLGDSLDTKWNSSGSAGGSAAVVDQQTGGICRIITHIDINDQWQLDWNAIRSLLVTKKVSAEVRATLNDQTIADVSFYPIVLFNDANNQIIIRFHSPTDPSIRIYCINGGAATFQDTGVALDNNPHIYQTQCHVHGGNHIHFFIDGVEPAVSPLTTNVPASYLQYIALIVTRANSSKIMDIDYVAIIQDR